MRVKRNKNHRRILRFFRLSFGVQAAAQMQMGQWFPFGSLRGLNGYTIWIYMGVSIHRGTPIAGWFISREKSNLKWMRTGGTPIYGNLHMTRWHRHSHYRIGTNEAVATQGPLAVGVWGPGQCPQWCGFIPLHLWWLWGLCWMLGRSTDMLGSYLGVYCSMDRKWFKWFISLVILRPNLDELTPVRFTMVHHFWGPFFDDPPPGQEPYHVLVDGTFLTHALQQRIYVKDMFVCAGDIQRDWSI